MKVFKYYLSNDEIQEIHLPIGSQILSAQIQNNNALSLWALCNEEERTCYRRVIGMYGTGEAMPDDNVIYISTVQMYGSSKVFHVFEVIEVKQ